MALSLSETIEAFNNRIISNKDIMDILELPTITENDTDEKIIKIKKNIISKVITNTAQEPYELGKKFDSTIIDGIEYSKYGTTRMTISNVQSIKMNSYLFSNPQVEFNIYYDNTKCNEVFKLIDLISKEFSGKEMEVKIENKKSLIKDIKQEIITTQTAIINNYERIGVRFSFYSRIY